MLLFFGGVTRLALGQPISVRDDDRFWDGRFFAPIPPVLNNATFGPNGTLYVVGDFNQIGGVLAHRLAAWDESTWYPLPDGYGASGGKISGNNFFLGADGRLYVDGRVEGKGYVARWDGIEWSVISGLNGAINAVAVSREGTVYAGGGGETCNNWNCTRYGYGVQRWSGSDWTAFPGDLLVVDALAVSPSNELYAVAGTSESPMQVRRWNQGAASWRTLGHLRSSIGGTRGFLVNRAGAVFVAGDLLLDEVWNWGVARWDGTAWSSIKTMDAGSYPQHLALDGSDRLYLTSYRGLRISIERWDGQSWVIVDDSLEGSDAEGLKALQFDADGTMYVAGGFKGPNGVANLARLSGGEWRHVVPRGLGTDGVIREFLHIGPGRVLASGNFRRAGKVDARGLAEWDGNAWSLVAADPAGSVLARAIDPDGTVYIGGRFQLDGITYYLARREGNAWVGLVSDMTSRVCCTPDISYLAFDTPGDLYAQGNFSSVAGVEAYGIARWDGVQWHALGAGLRSGERALRVNRMLFDDGDLYVGGDFQEAGGFVVNGIARWDGVTWHALGSGMEFPYNHDGVGVVLDMAFVDGILYAGGTFDRAGGVAASHIAAWDGTNWAPLREGCDAQVQSLAVGPNGDLYVGGQFFWASNVWASRVARWTGDTWESLGSGLSAGISGEYNGYGYLNVHALAFDGDGALLVGGSNIMKSGDQASSNIARWLKSMGPNAMSPGDGDVSFEVKSTYPNPFSDEIRITLSVVTAQVIRMVVSDLIGREVAALHDGLLSARDHEFVVDTRTWPSGVFILSVSGENRETHRAIVHVR